MSSPPPAWLQNGRCSAVPCGGRKMQPEIRLAEKASTNGAAPVLQRTICSRLSVGTASSCKVTQALCIQPEKPEHPSSPGGKTSSLPSRSTMVLGPRVELTDPRQEFCATIQATEDTYLGTGGFFPVRGLPLSCLSVAGGNGGFGILGKCSPGGLQC